MPASSRLNPSPPDPSVPMMPMMMPPFPPFQPPFISSAPAPPPQLAPEIPAPPPLPSSVPIQPPPPAEPKLSLSELKAKLLANRKLKQKFSTGLDTPEASDTPTTPDFAAATPIPARSVVLQEPQAVSLSTSPVIAHNVAQSVVTSRAESPSMVPASVGSSAPPEIAPSSSAIPVNSRRPGAADFVDVPPSRLASSTFFRGNARRTFAPPHPKRLVVDLDDSSDDGSNSDVESDPDSQMRSTSADPGNEADALRLMHEAEMRIALERKMAAVAENRAKLAAFAARKKALAAKNAATNTPSPVMLSTGVNLAPPSIPDLPSVSPTPSRSSIQTPEIINTEIINTISPTTVTPQNTGAAYSGIHFSELIAFRSYSRQGKAESYRYLPTVR